MRDVDELSVEKRGAKKERDAEEEGRGERGAEKDEMLSDGCC